MCPSGRASALPCQEKAVWPGGRVAATSTPVPWVANASWIERIGMPGRAQECGRSRAIGAPIA